MMQLSEDRLAAGRPLGGQARTLFTCTTYLSLPGKFLQCLRALASIQAVHSRQELARISRFLIINEHAADAQVDHRAVLERCFPWAEVVQKTAQQAGQAASLNLILAALEGFDVWVHWEESWVCRSPFIAQAQEVLATTAITQLQVSADIWHQMGPSRLRAATSPGGTRYAHVSPHPTFLAILPQLNLATLPELWRAHGLEVIWPLYSLRPSVNRAACYPPLGRFDCSPRMWPHLFEWDFGLRWLQAGGHKGILLPEAAVRQPWHRSTHAQ